MEEQNALTGVESISIVVEGCFTIIILDIVAIFHSPDVQFQRVDSGLQYEVQEMNR